MEDVVREREEAWAGVGRRHGLSWVVTMPTARLRAASMDPCISETSAHGNASAAAPSEELNVVSASSCSPASAPDSAVETLYETDPEAEVFEFSDGLLIGISFVGLRRIVGHCELDNTR